MEISYGENSLKGKILIYRIFFSIFCSTLCNTYSLKAHFNTIWEFFVGLDAGDQRLLKMPGFKHPPSDPQPDAMTTGPERRYFYFTKGWLSYRRLNNSPGICQSC